jgi:hypothetical protein
MMADKIEVTSASKQTPYSVYASEAYTVDRARVSAQPTPIPFGNLAAFEGPLFVVIGFDVSRSELPERFSVWLPTLLINDQPSALPKIEFTKRPFRGFVAMNC